MKTMKYTTVDGYTFEGIMFRDTHGQCIKVPYEYRGIVNMGDMLTTELGDVIDLVDEDMEIIDDEMYAVFYYRYNYQ